MLEFSWIFLCFGVSEQIELLNELWNGDLSMYSIVSCADIYSLIADLLLTNNCMTKKQEPFHSKSAHVLHMA